MTGHDGEVATGVRFAFGENWRRFLARLDDQRIAAAEDSLRAMLGSDDLAGLRVLDIGSGSGLFSLAARRLGATVRSFDCDTESVACTAELRRRYFGEDPDWTVEMGSVLDDEYMARLGVFDVVYAWGVLHHTGDMWHALANAATRVAPGGRLFVAIYNDQGWLSRYWTWVKRVYNTGPLLRLAMTLWHTPYFFGARLLVRALTGRLRLTRGMSLWYDMHDWLGGYPFEVARPEEIVSFYEERGFTLMTARTCGRRSGCNEFVFRRQETASTGWRGTPP